MTNQFDQIYTVDSSYTVKGQYEEGFRNTAPKRGSKVFGLFENKIELEIRVNRLNNSTRDLEKFI